MSTIVQSIFYYKKVRSTLSGNKDGDLFACYCKDKFLDFVYKRHGHVHTGYLDLIENIHPRNIMKMGVKFRETPPCNILKLPIFNEMLLKSQPIK